MWYDKNRIPLERRDSDRMIYSQKEQKRRRKFRIVVILLVAAILICIGVLVGIFLKTHADAAETAYYVSEQVSRIGSLFFITNFY